MRSLRLPCWFRACALIGSGVSAGSRAGFGACALIGSGVCAGSRAGSGACALIGSGVCAGSRAGSGACALIGSGVCAGSRAGSGACALIGSGVCAGSRAGSGACALIGSGVWAAVLLSFSGAESAGERGSETLCPVDEDENSSVLEPLTCDVNGLCWCLCSFSEPRESRGCLCCSVVAWNMCLMKEWPEICPRSCTDMLLAAPVTNGQLGDLALCSCIGSVFTKLLMSTLMSQKGHL